MRLRANVTRTTGATVHRRGEPVNRAIVPGEQLPAFTAVEIHESRSGGIFLYYYDAAGRCIADTWHATVGDAKEQAKFELGIEAADWVEVAN